MVGAEACRPARVERCDAVADFGPAVELDAVALAVVRSRWFPLRRSDPAPRPGRLWSPGRRTAAPARARSCDQGRNSCRIRPGCRDARSQRMRPGAAGATCRQIQGAEVLQGRRGPVRVARRAGGGQARPWPGPGWLRPRPGPPPCRWRRRVGRGRRSRRDRNGHGCGGWPRVWMARCRVCAASNRKVLVSSNISAGRPVYGSARSTATGGGRGNSRWRRWYWRRCRGRRSAASGNWRTPARHSAADRCRAADRPA